MPTDAWDQRQKPSRFGGRIDQEGVSNLQALRIADADNNQGEPLRDYSTVSQDGQAFVFFRNLEQCLISRIQQCDVVLGCVAWLTSEPILQALAGIRGVSIIIQKEDFLRPDFTSKSDWAYHLRQLYDCLPRTLARYELKGTILDSMSYAASPDIDPIRCVGNYNTTKVPAFPRSHHKFVLFCNYHSALDSEEDEEEYGPQGWVEPKEVWTGSFNFTKTAGMSFENAVVLRDPNILQAFYQEYAQVAALSEPLDWSAAWSLPEWRIGS